MSERINYPVPARGVRSTRINPVPSTLHGRRAKRALLAVLCAALAGCSGDPVGPGPQPGFDATRLVAFAYRGTAAPSRVGVVRADATAQRFVTDGKVEATMPSWSPDGTQLAMSYQGVPGFNPQLWIINIDGTGLRAVPIGDRAGRSPSWSPDGSKLVFDDFYGLFLVKPDGTGLAPLLDSEHNNGVSQWSPDGNWILFTGFMTGFGDVSSRQLYIVRPDGSGLRRLAASVSQAITKAAWSPDGRRIAFDAADGDVRIVDVATDVVTKLMTTVARETQPSWSPDGSHIAFTRRFDNGSHVFIAKADGTDEQQLTTGEGWFEMPAWQPARRGVP